MLHKHVRIEGNMLCVTLDKHKHNRKSAAASIMHSIVVAR